MHLGIDRHCPRITFGLECLHNSELFLRVFVSDGGGPVPAGDEGGLRDWIEGVGIHAFTIWRRRWPQSLKSLVFPSRSVVLTWQYYCQLIANRQESRKPA